MDDEINLPTDSSLEATQELEPYNSQSLGDDEFPAPASPQDMPLTGHVMRQFWRIHEDEIIGESGIDLNNIYQILNQPNAYRKLSLCMCLSSEDQLDELLRIFQLPHCQISEISLAHNPLISLHFDKVLTVLTLMQPRLASINLSGARIDDMSMSKLTNIITPASHEMTFYPCYRRGDLRSPIDLYATTLVTGDRRSPLQQDPVLSSNIEKIVFDYCIVSPDSLSKLINELYAPTKTHKPIHLSLNGIPIAQTSVVAALAACLQAPSYPIVKLELENTGLTTTDIHNLQQKGTSLFSSLFNQLFPAKPAQLVPAEQKAKKLSDGQKRQRLG